MPCKLTLLCCTQLSSFPVVWPYRRGVCIMSCSIWPVWWYTPVRDKLLFELCCPYLFGLNWCHGWTSVLVFAVQSIVAGCWGRSCMNFFIDHSYCAYFNCYYMEEHGVAVGFPALRNLDLLMCHSSINVYISWRKFISSSTIVGIWIDFVWQSDRS